MRRFFAAVTLATVFLGGCAGLGPERVPSAGELAGTYFMGDGLGICMEATLHPDGSLGGVACAGEHIGSPGREFKGSWFLDGATIKISTPAGEIKDAEAFFWQGARRRSWSLRTSMAIGSSHGPFFANPAEA
jgi:hypothetical protein